MMDKKEVCELVKQINSDLKYKTMNFGTLSYIILKTMELKDQGVKSSDFEQNKTIFDEELE
jgi:CRISPR/Cas system endoribonuclease Cas6 (RAMP superfamily)